MPKITVLMTMYNGMPYLPQAVESVLTQRFDDFQLLVVDDGSTDDSRDCLCGYDDPRIRLLQNEVNIGQTACLNRGLAAAQSDLVARMDQDDICHRDRLGKQVDFFAMRSDVAVLGTGVRWIDAESRVIGGKSFPRDAAAARFAQLLRCPLAHGAVTFSRRVVWDELGGYDPSFRYSQDWELWGRVLVDHEIANLDEALVDIRVHGASATANHGPAIAAEDERVYHRSWAGILGLEAVPNGWGDRLGELVALDIGSCTEHVEMVADLYDLYCEQFPAAAADPGVVAELARHYGRLLRHSRKGPLHKLSTALYAGGKVFGYWRKARGQAG